MADNQTLEWPDRLGLTNDELAVHRTVFAPDALKDTVMVLSGGAGGIGRAIAWLFARLGAHVVVVGRDQDKLSTLTSNLAAKGLMASARVVDIRDPDAVKTLFDGVGRAQGAIDGVLTV